MKMQPEPSLAQTTINVFGDFVANESLSQRFGLDGVDAVFSRCFRHSVSKADLNVFNLESAVTAELKPAKKAGPRLRGTESILGSFEDEGTWIATLANNHIMDFGIEGLRDTETALRRHDINYVGASSSGERSAHCVQKKINGIRVGIINVAEQEFGVVRPGEAGVQMEDVGQLYYWLTEEKKNSDVVILVVHGGSEYFPLPSPRRLRRARLYVDFGADAVIYHHTHVVSAFEEYNGSPIFYGLGNFVFDRPGSGLEWNTGMVARLSIDGSQGKLRGDPGYFRYVPGSGVCLMSQPETDEMAANVEAMNEVVGDDRRLEQEWEKFCEQRRRGVLRLTNLIPRWQMFLLRKGILKRPRFHDNSLLGGLNVLRCAAHREVAETIFESEARKRFQRFV